MAVSRDAIKREVGPALYRVMEPGDQIVAGTFALAGAGPWWNVVGAILLGACGFTAVGLGGDFAWGTPAAALVPLLLLATRRPVFVAVTQRQLICYGLAKTSNVPVRLLFRAPLPAVRATSRRWAFPTWRSIRYDGPGAGERGLRLNVQRPWHLELDEVVAALAAQEASVTGLSPAQAPLRGPVHQ